MSSADARGGVPAERFRLVRLLGARAVPTWAALDASGGEKPRLVVLERVTRGGEYGDQDIADWVRDARRAATLEHPNVGRVRDVVISGDEVTVVSDYLDGVRWSELIATEPRPPLEAALRVLVDVLTGLGAIHNLRDAKREPMKLVHGELTPDCIVVGTDGGARVICPARLRPATARPGRSASAYLAPEILLADESANARADVYSVGVLLWELLSGRPLFPDIQPSAIVTHLLSGRVPLATIPQGHAWAAPLAGLAARALSADPAKRFTSAAAMAAEIRRVAGPKLAPQANLASHVQRVFGERVRARREELERGEGRPAPPSVEAEVASEDIRISLVPTPVPPPPTATTKPPPPVEPPPLPQPGKPGKPAPAKVSAPTPYVAFEIPLAARIPKDLEPGVGEVAVPAPPVATRSQSPAPAVPPVVTAVEEAQAAPRKRPRGVVLALLAGPVVLVVALLAWWLASPSSDEARHAASSASTTIAVAVPHPPAASPSTTTPPTPAAAAETVAPQAQVVPSEPSASATATATETAAAPANAAPPAQLAPAAGVPAAPAPPVRPQRPKYEPEGI